MEIDVNSDGSLSKEETIDYHRENGMPITQEALAELDQIYNYFDSNHNGSLEKNELYNYLKYLEEQS